MRILNPKFRSLKVGDVIQCMPDLYDRDLTDCKVLKISDTPIVGGVRIEISVDVIERTNYQTWIFDEKDTDL